MTRYLKKNEHYMKQMSNKEFYDKISEYEQKGLLIFMPKRTDEKLVVLKIDTRHIGIHPSIFSFGEVIIDKIKNKQFFTQKLLEEHLGKSNPVIMRLLYQGEYTLLKRNMTKFYIKKDW